MEPISILYEDEDVLAVNKPAGLMVHADGKSDGKTLTDWVLEKYPEVENVGESIELSDGRVLKRPGIVHRLDKDTSGVILIAKTDKGFKTLKRQFKERKIIKSYNAFVYGAFKEKRGLIDRPIGRSKSDFRKRSAERGIRGEKREATTVYRVIETKDNISFVEAIPKTGRTHQIRVHFKAVGRPVVADNLYASSKEKVLGFERLALHAKSITFGNTQGKTVTVEAPFPSDFEKAIEIMKEKN